MLTDLSRRWANKRARFVPPSEVFEPRHYEVAELSGDAEAKAFILQHHYSGSYPAARYRFGLYWGGLLVGAVVFSHPMNDAVLSCLPGEGLERIELGRLVLLDRVPFNAESWTVTRCFELLRRHGITGVVSFADPVARTTSSGETVFKGHVGQIYKALNGVYTGRGSKQTMRLLPDGTVFSARCVSKIRAKDQGWRYSADVLARYGAKPLHESDDARAWLDQWLPRITRPLKHAGNHRYLFGLDRRTRKHLPQGKPYPTFDHPAKAAA